jgi:hypothetical protein
MKSWFCLVCHAVESRKLETILRDRLVSIRLRVLRSRPPPPEACRNQGARDTRKIMLARARSHFRCRRGSQRNAVGCTYTMSRNGDQKVYLPLIISSHAGARHVRVCVFWMRFFLTSIRVAPDTRSMQGHMILTKPTRPHIARHIFNASSGLKPCVPQIVFTKIHAQRHFLKHGPSISRNSYTHPGPIHLGVRPSPSRSYGSSIRCPRPLPRALVGLLACPYRWLG